MLKKGSKLYSILTGTCPKCQSESMYVNKNPLHLGSVLKMNENCSHCHLKYQIEAVPSLLIVDKHGNVIKTYMGNVTATDLWAAVAQARGSELGCTDSGSCTSH